MTRLAVAFTAVTMTANIMSLRMVAPLGIVMDAGTLLYPVTFLIRDALHRRAGLRESDRAVSASALANLFMFAMFAVAAWLPYDKATGTQEEFASVLLPGMLIVIGSIAGQFTAERIDGRIFHRVWLKRGHVRAALISNAISIPIDTAVMCSIAFGLTTSLGTLASTVAANVTMKYAVMLLSVGAMALRERGR